MARPRFLLLFLLFCLTVPFCVNVFVVVVVVVIVVVVIVVVKLIQGKASLQDRPTKGLLMFRKGGVFEAAPPCFAEHVSGVLYPDQFFCQHGLFMRNCHNDHLKFNRVRPQDSGTSNTDSANDSEALSKLREEVNTKNALTYTLQNKITSLEREAKEWVEKVATEQLKCQKLERDVKDERSKRETIRRQMEGFKMQVQCLFVTTMRFYMPYPRISI